jgi:hypothetical protein
VDGAERDEEMTKHVHSAKREFIVNSRRFNWLSVLAALAGGTIAGVVVWFMLNNAVRINGRGLLAGAPWPLDMPVPYAVVGAVIGIIFTIISQRRAQALRDDLRAVAGGLGLEFEEGDVQISVESRPKKLILGDWGRCQNRLSGTVKDVPLQMFDLTTISPGSENNTHQKWTAVLFQETPLPSFACNAKTWSTFGQWSLVPAVNFDQNAGDPVAREAVEKFQKSYRLTLPETASPADEEEVRQLFVAPKLEAMARQPGWHVQASDGCLLLLRSGTVPAAERPTIWRDAIELRRALLAPASSALLPIPAAVGMERDRQGNRQRGRMWGGLAGAVVGFFGAFIVFTSFMFGRRMGPGLGPSPLFYAFFPTMVGGLGLGGFVGSRLGKWLADRDYRPSPERIPARPVSRGWVIGGAFAGWALGIPIGMTLTFLIDRVIHIPWLMPITFFGPPLLCLVLGGFSGYRVARRRAGA